MRNPAAPDRVSIGALGEECARRWYVEHGYVVLATNWRCRSGEIDLVVGRDGCVVVAEVKTRSDTYFGTPATAVGRAKQRRLRQLAVLWLRDNPIPRSSIRFDVVEVVLAQGQPLVTVIESAF